MQNGARPVVLALFFVLGMAFTAAMFLFARPDWEDHEKVRIVTEQRPPQTLPRRYAPLPPEPTLVLPPSEEITPQPIAVTTPPKVQLAEEPAPKETAFLQAEDERPPPTSPVVIWGRKDSQRKPVQNTIAPLSFANHNAAKTLRGRATLLDKAPGEKPFPFDPACGQLQDSPRRTRLYAVGPDQGLADVVVKVIELPKRHWLEPNAPHVIANRKCMFEPYISAMQLGQLLRVVNEDPFMHNVHIMPGLGGEKNQAQMPKSKPIDFKPTAAEDFLRIKCDVHPWMFAYVTVVDHPYFAVTDAEGKFEIKGLPVGRYSVVAMHRKAGTQRFNDVVEIGENGAELNLKFKVWANK